MGRAGGCVTPLHLLPVFSSPMSAKLSQATRCHEQLLAGMGVRRRRGSGEALKDRLPERILMTATSWPGRKEL